MPDLSVVIPLYNERTLLEELVRRLTATLTALRLTWEVVLVDDGSRDGTLEFLRELVRSDGRFRAVSLSRNFGHQPAIAAGLARARGRAVVVMDGDLQDPPEVIAPLVQSWQDGNDVVLAVRRTRAESGARAAAFGAFYRVMALLSDLDLGRQSGVFCLMSRTLVDHLAALPEHNRYLPGLRAWLGFRQGVVLYDRAARHAGAPKQGLLRLARYAADAIFSFSYKPLRIASIVGALVWLATGLYALVLVSARLLGINVVPGFTTPTVSILLLGGLQLLCLGILGEYLARIYDEVKRRPLYIEKEFVGRED